MFLSVNPSIASTSSQTPLSTPQVPKVEKVTVLDTPTGFLRVREDSSITSSEIGRVSPEDSLELVTEKEGWFPDKNERWKNRLDQLPIRKERIAPKRLILFEHIIVLYNSEGWRKLEPIF